MSSMAAVPTAMSDGNGSGIGSATQGLKQLHGNHQVVLVLGHLDTLATPALQGLGAIKKLF
jgi:hypothetical protein